MASGYIPSREADLDPFLENFDDKIAADPTDYGLVAGDATAITAAVTAWHNAYLAAINPTTRNSGTIQTKNLQKANVLSVVRGYARTIRANSAVSDALKLGIGLHIPDTEPTPIPPPSTYPVLSVIGGAPLEQEVRAADVTTPTRRGKPAGVSSLLLFRAVGEAAATDPSQAEFFAVVGKTRTVSAFGSGDNGKIATYFGRWTNGRGEMGPWSAPVSKTIAA